MKKIIPFLVVIIVCLCTLYIYKIFEDDKVYYLALGDSLAVGTNSDNKNTYGYADYIADYYRKRGNLEKYIKSFAKNGYKINDLMNDINNNKEITLNDETITIKNALIKADIITLSIGSNDVIEAYRYKEDLDERIDLTVERMEELFQVLREYNKEKIIVLGYYNPFYFYNNWNVKVKTANSKLELIASKYDIIYIDIFDLFQSNTYLPSITDPHPNTGGYLKIGEKIMNKIEEEE